MQPLFDLFAMLSAAREVHHVAHWTCLGPNFYGDHLMFDRIYEAVAGQIDPLAELAVQAFGAGVVEPVAQAAAQARFLATWMATPDLVARSLLVEQAIDLQIKVAREQLALSGDLSYGLDNLLAGFAQAHRESLFLLGQRAANR